MSNNCPICIEPFTNFKRKKLDCPYCSFNACKECTQKYLTTTTNAPHCMSCKKEWDDNICSQILGNFMTGKYRKHRKQLMFDIERAYIIQSFISKTLMCIFVLYGSVQRI